MYIHRDGLHVAFSHSPFGIGGDIQALFVSSKLKAKQSLTAEIHTNVSLMMLFSQNDNNNPVAFISQNTLYKLFWPSISITLILTLTRIKLMCRVII